MDIKVLELIATLSARLRIAIDTEDPIWSDNYDYYCGSSEYKGTFCSLCGNNRDKGHTINCIWSLWYQLLSEVEYDYDEDGELQLLEGGTKEVGTEETLKLKNAQERIKSLEKTETFLRGKHQDSAKAAAEANRKLESIRRALRTLNEFQAAGGV